MLDAKINLLFVASPTNTPLTTLALEFGLNFSPPGTTLISHLPERPAPHTIVPIPFPDSKLLSSNETAPILYSGASHGISTNPLIIPILRAPAESFAADSDTDAGADAIVDAFDKGGEGLWAGSQIGLVSGVQTLDGARATWVGGPELFSDDFAIKEVQK